MDSARIIIPGLELILRDADVGSQYPNAIVKRKLFPRHLGEEWLVNFNNTIVERLAAKDETGKEAISADEKRILTGLAEWLKLALNGGGFGMTNQPDSWQYDPFVHFSCTIGNQFEMLMLIESMELNGIHCVSANTDGIVCLLPKEMSDKYYEICHEWEAIVGNTKMGKLEYKDYDELIQEHVNSYIAVSKGKMKLKGRMNYEVPLNKNNMKDITRIQRKAIQEYFSKKIPIETTIRGCENIFMFVFGYKSRDYSFIATNKKGEKDDLGHLVRCYASTEGIKMSKSKEEEEGVTSRRGMKIIKDSWVTVYNQHIPMPISEYQINYDWYISGAQELIRKIEVSKFVGPGKKAKKLPPLPPKEQLSMF